MNTALLALAADTYSYEDTSPPMSAGQTVWAVIAWIIIGLAIFGHVQKKKQKKTAAAQLRFAADPRLVCRQCQTRGTVRTTPLSSLSGGGVQATCRHCFTAYLL